MPFSQHSHSGQFCRHGSGILEDVVLAAIDRGMVAYALTEHVPRYSPEFRYPEESDMSVADLESQFSAFLAEARRLQVKYASQIDLIVGCETEFVTRDDTLAMLSSLPANPPFLLTVGSSPLAMYTAYFDAQFAMLELVQPKVVGHFDLIGIFATQAGIQHVDLVMHLWDSHVKRNLDWIAAHGALVEINSRAWKKGVPGYPHVAIAKRIKNEYGERVRFTLSDDAHAPGDVGMGYVEQVRRYIEQGVGLAELYYWSGSGEIKRVEVPGEDGGVWQQFFDPSK
ncbi:polymerase/histidinol phosphatase-like protein [Catenaria anguillulae PL171]|uniref:Histidinol-phosphatase n=1 Tax=Catenaria anguillulae PL171 TaxID=765915 RepID=A0A1Y2HNT2_9FUNG|nr:polymerase/histidinol phosphatase-like protein [Catenaria anguillulae PL171]